MRRGVSQERGMQLSEVKSEVGTIVFWNPKGYGFIAPDEDGDNIFFHCSALEGERGQRFIAEGTQVEFQVGVRNGRKCAIKVRPLERAQ